jgi:hypothetical protein
MLITLIILALWACVSTGWYIGKHNPFNLKWSPSTSFLVLSTAIVIAAVNSHLVEFVDLGAVWAHLVALAGYAFVVGRYWSVLFK